MEVDIIGIALAGFLIESSRAMDYEDFVLLIEVSGSSLDRANNNMARRKTWLVFTPFFFLSWKSRV